MEFGLTNTKTLTIFNNKSSDFLFCTLKKKQYAIPCSVPVMIDLTRSHTYYCCMKRFEFNKIQ